MLLERWGVVAERGRRWLGGVLWRRDLVCSGFPSMLAGGTFDMMELPVWHWRLRDNRFEVVPVIGHCCYAGFMNGAHIKNVPCSGL